MRTIGFALLLLLNYLVGNAQIPNNDFESWDSQPRLQDWQTNSFPLTLPPWNPYVVRKDTDSYSGLYDAYFYANNVFKAYATVTFPVQYHPVQLSAWVKYSFAPCVNDSGFAEQDTISIDVDLLNGGAIVDSGRWSYHQTGWSPNYQQLLIPISNHTTVFDSCRITIRGGRVYGGCGIIAAPTELYVDHLELNYSSLNTCIDSALICDTCFCPTVYEPVCGCDSVTYNNACEATSRYGVKQYHLGSCLSSVHDLSGLLQKISLLPNPARGQTTLRFQLSRSSPVQVTIRSIIGQIVYRHRETNLPVGLNQISLPLQDLSRGVYLVALSCNGRNSVSLKLVKE